MSDCPNCSRVELIQERSDKYKARAEKAEAEVELLKNDNVNSEMNLAIMTQEVERLKQYIRENGYCGYHGAKYSDVYADCTKCMDNEHCERYQALTATKQP